MNYDPISVSDACGLARLALELAKRHAHDDPHRCLPEAARLANEARGAWANELERTSPEQQHMEMLERFVFEKPKAHVPFDRLCRPGSDKGKHYETFTYAEASVESERPGPETEGKRDVRLKDRTFKWLVFTHEKSFKNLLRKYVTPYAEAEHNAAVKYASDTEKAAERKAAAATKASAEAKEAADSHKDEALLAEAKKRESAAKADAVSAARDFDAARTALKAPVSYQREAVMQLLGQAKEGKLDVVTVKALHDLRSKSKAERAAKGGVAKAKKAERARACPANAASRKISSPGKPWTQELEQAKKTRARTQSSA